MRKYTNNQRTEIVRTVTIVQKSETENMVKRHICNGFDNINVRVAERCEKIAQLASFTPAKITIKKTKPCNPFIVGDIQDVFPGLKNVDDLRVIINLEPHIRSNISEEISILTRHISHLIEISFIDTNSDLSFLGDFCETIRADYSIEKTFKIIEDVMLDIAMYNALIAPDYDSSLDARRQFSHKKIDFIEQQNMDSEIWNIEKNKNYIAFAGYFWRKDGFDYLGYIKCWLNIRKKLCPDASEVPIKPIKDQLKRIADSGELPVKSIIENYDSLPEGEYVLAWLSRIPKTRTAQRQLMPIFGGSKLTRNKFKLIPKDKVHTVDRYPKYVKLFPIYK